MASNENENNEMSVWKWNGVMKENDIEWKRRKAQPAIKRKHIEMKMAKGGGK
jgi:hypothetical protein